MIPKDSTRAGLRSVSFIRLWTGSTASSLTTWEFPFVLGQREIRPDRIARVSSLDFLMSYGPAPLGWSPWSRSSRPAARLLHDTALFRLISAGSTQMNILLAFAPFLAFALVDRALGSLDGLLAGAVVSIAMLVRETMLHGKSPKVLEIGTVMLFAGLAAWFLAFKPAWSIIDVRLRVDLGLLLIVIISMLIGKPFTLQYARENVQPELWSSPTFLKTSYVISAAWVAAFAVLVAVDMLWIYRPDVPPRIGVWATIAALFGAVKFTGWYPRSLQSQAPRKTADQA